MLASADLTRLCWLLYVHGGRRENFPSGGPRESAGRWEALGLATIESEWGEGNDHAWDFAPVEHVEITTKGREVCAAMVAAARAALDSRA